MKISQTAIRRPVTVIMLVMMILVLGFVSLTNISLDMLPNLSMPVAMVMTSYPGAGPTEVETLITKPLEQVLGTVPDFKSITSTSSSGQSMITVEFVQGTNMDFAALDVREKIDLVKSMLPEDATSPTVMQINTSMIPVLELGLSAGDNMDLVELKNIAEDKIQSRLERLNGVASVTIYGGVTREVKINVIPQKMELYGIGITQLTQILQSENLTMPGGVVQQGDTKYNVRTTAEFKDINQIKNVMIPTIKGNIKLEEIAQVIDGYADNEVYSHMDGQPCLFLAVQKQSTANTVNVSREINKELEVIKKEMNNINFKLVYDQADYIEKSIGNVASNAIIGGLLAVVILFLFLRNIRTTLIIGISIPISIIATFIMMYFSNITLNIMSMGGLALGVGMLVDNSIVVLESIFRYREQGYSMKEAASEGAGEVAMAVTASTLTTIAVFLPIVFIQKNLVVSMFREMALTVTFSLAASLVIALTLVPMLASKMLTVSKRDQERKKKDGEGKVFHTYKGLLHWALKHRLIVILFTLGLFVASIVYSVLFVGTEYFPETDEGTYSMSISLPKGTVIAETQDITNRILKVLEDFSTEFQEAEYTFSIVGSSGDMMFEGSDTGKAAIYSSFGPRTKRDKTTKELVDILRDRLKNIAGAKISITPTSSLGMDSSNGGNPISISVKGDEMEELEVIAKEIADGIKKIEGTREVSTSVDEKIKEVQVQVDRDKSAAYGISSSNIAQTIQAYVMGKVATKYRVTGDEIDIRIRAESISRESINDIHNIYIKNTSGVAVPLYEVAKIEIAESPISIARNDQTRTVTVRGGISGRSAGLVFADITKYLDTVETPSGYSIDFGGQNKDMNEAFTGLAIALLLAILLVYMVMASQFESLLHPFTIMFSLPLAFIGVVLLNGIFGKAIGVMTLAGFIVLAGIVVNNAIVMVDYINTLRSRGYSRNEAIEIAGPVRLRPILMTTLTTILGLIPLALGIGEGAEMQAPLAITIIGGLAFSTLLTLVFIPVIYTLADGLSSKVKRFFARFNRHDIDHQENKIDNQENVNV